MNAIQRRLSAYRDELKGIAILMVVFFHARLELQGFAYEVQQLGYGGVDVFFFLSGFGLCRSLQRDDDLRRYLTRRARRLLPAYLPVCLAWLCVMLPLLGLSRMECVRTAAGNLLMVGFFGNTPVLLNWYVSALAVSLMLAPCLYAAFKGPRHPWRRVAALMMGAFAMGLCFIGDERYMAVSRLPVFVLGMGFALPAREDGGKYAALWGWLAFAAGLAALEMCMHRYPDTLIELGMYWHPYVLIAPAVCMGLGWLFERMEPARRAFAPFRYVGQASFEIFLFNAWAELLGKKAGLFHGSMAWALWSLGSIVLGCAYHAGIVALSNRRTARSVERA